MVGKDGRCEWFRQGNRRPESPFQGASISTRSRLNDFNPNHHRSRRFFPSSQPSASVGTASAPPGLAAAGTVPSRSQVRAPSRATFCMPLYSRPELRFPSVVSSHLPDRPPPARGWISRRRSRARCRARKTPSYCSRSRPSCAYHDNAAHPEPEAAAAIDTDNCAAPACWGIRNLNSVLG